MDNCYESIEKMKKKYLFSVMIILAVVFFVYIKFNQGFYDSTMSDFDLWRIPLIKPYEINSASHGKTWSVMDGSGMTFDDKFAISVDSVGLNKYVIGFYSNNEIISGRVTQAWYIFDTNKKNGKYFKSKLEYNSYMRDIYKIDNINFYSPQIIFKNYENNLTLPPEWDSLVAEDKKNKWW